MESFFNCFEYACVLHDAIDKGLVYEGCVISRNIATKSGCMLKSGEEFEAVWFSFGRQEFNFIKSWVPKDPEDPECPHHIAGPGSISIPQSELAPFLVWDDKDLPPHDCTEINKFIFANKEHWFKSS